MPRLRIASWLSVLVPVLVPVARPAAGGEVSGQVSMPAVCSPAVSAAVVTLEPTRGGGAGAGSPEPGPALGADVAPINQRGLQSTPRVQAIALGQSVRFTNEDAEIHHVHIGNAFNVSMSPGQPHVFTPERPGVYTLLCDVHGHMR